MPENDLLGGSPSSCVVVWFNIRGCAMSIAFNVRKFATEHRYGRPPNFFNDHSAGGRKAQSAGYSEAKSALFRNASYLNG
jgi:hypothetical protein